MRSRSAAILACTFLAACGPKMPTEAEARASATKHEPSLRDIQRAVTDAVTSARLTSAAEACKDPKATGACIAARGEQSEQTSRLRASLSGVVLPKAVDDAHALGLCLTLRERGAPAGEVLASVTIDPCPPGRRVGSVPASAGIAIGAYEVGRGLYQTAWSSSAGKRGDGEYHPGTEVEWTFTIGTIDARVDVYFLDDGTVRPR